MVRGALRALHRLRLLHNNINDVMIRGWLASRDVSGHRRIRMGVNTEDQRGWG